MTKVQQFVFVIMLRKIEGLSSIRTVSFYVCTKSAPAAMRTKQTEIITLTV